MRDIRYFVISIRLAKIAPNSVCDLKVNKSILNIVFPCFDSNEEILRTKSCITNK